MSKITSTFGALTAGVVLAMIAAWASSVYLPADGGRDAAPGNLRVGAVAADLPIFSSQSTKMVVVAVRSTCAACRNAAAFYHDLFADLRHKGVSVWVLGSDDDTALDDYASKLSAPVVRTKSLAALTTTVPVLFEIGYDKVVTDVWAGRPSPFIESAMRASLGLGQ